MLVTASACGNDSYEFTRDKPLALISGGELIYLLRNTGTRHASTWRRQRSWGSGSLAKLYLSSG